MADLEFAGLTRKDCCVECGDGRCIITENSSCGHPYKGGLQGKDAQNSKTMSRFQRARKLILIDEVEAA